MKINHRNYIHLSYTNLDNSWAYSLSALDQRYTPLMMNTNNPYNSVHIWHLIYRFQYINLFQD